MLLHEVVANAARRFPGAPALVAGDRTATFAALDDRVARLARAVQRVTSPGDRVAVVADNGMPWVECYYGVPRAGCVLTPLNQRLAPAEQAALLAASGARVLLGDDRYLEPLTALADAFPSVETVVPLDDGYEDLVAGEPPAPVDVPGQDDRDVAWLLFTSGTTGRPKGAMLTHAGLLAAVLNTTLSRPVSPDDVYLFPFPLCHVAGYNVVHHHLHARPVVLLPRFEATAFVEAVERHGATTTSLAPTMIASLLDHLEATGRSVPTLRSVGYGASGIAPDLLRRAIDRLGADFAQGYGMTELSGNAAFLDPDAHRRGLGDAPWLLGAAGRPGPLVALRVVDEDGLDVAPGEVGEIVVRGDQVTAGYWDEPEATAAAFAGGWFHTGDLGRFDGEGYLYVVDRKKDIVVTGGENVASREVEDALLEHPDVAAAAVVGVPDPHWGEAVCAVVVPRPGAGLSADDVVAHARTRLAGFKKPRHVLFVDALPVNASGKVRKPELREWAAQAFLRP